MRTILLMTDFSNNARNAINYAIEAFGEDMNYLLLHTYTYKRSAGSLADIGSIAEGNSSIDLNGDLAFIKARFPEYPNLKITKMSEFGEPWNVLGNIQKKLHIDLVVMGTKGASGLSKVLFGSITASVIRDTTLPVLAIPEHVKFEPPRKIVFAADTYDKQTEEMTDTLKQFVERFESEVSVLHVINKDQLSAEEINDRTKKLENSDYLGDIKKSVHVVESDNLSISIEQFCEEKQANLLAVISRHNRLLDRIFHSSISLEMIFKARLPVLALDNSRAT